MAKGKKTGGGSRKGVPNKVTSDLRAMVLTALDKSGGVKYLQRQAEETPASFLTLVGRCLPTKVEGGGPNGEHEHEVHVTIGWGTDG